MRKYYYKDTAKKTGKNWDLIEKIIGNFFDIIKRKWGIVAVWTNGKSKLH